MKLLLSTLLLLVAHVLFSANTSIKNTDKQADMFTPDYYTSVSNDDALHQAIDSFVIAVRQIPFSHPLRNTDEEQQSYTVKRDFGDGMGANNDAQHHPAIDMYIGNKEANVPLFAVIEGRVNTYYDAAKYRDYITITQTVKDKEEKILGSILVIYGHVDLNLDTLGGRYMNGKQVNIGDTLSTHLYANTMGGPHLHFEVRYYRPEDTPPTEFYGINPVLYTTPSAEPWPYGRWNPEIGYGYGHPENHFNNSLISSINNLDVNLIKCFPNPTQGKMTLELNASRDFSSYRILQMNGKLLETHPISSSSLELDLSPYPSGLYIILLENTDGNTPIKVIKK